MSNELIEKLAKERAVIIEEDGAFVFQQVNHLKALCEAYTEATQAQDGWISVEDSLPINDLTVAVVTWNEEDAEQEFSHDAYDPIKKRWDWIRTHQVITHWMPLPSAPKVKTSLTKGE